MCLPVAWWMALATAAATPVIDNSPTPRQPKRVDVWVEAIDEVGLDVRDVGVDRDGIVGEVVGHRAGRAPIVDRMFHQGGADPHDDAAEHLAAGRSSG